MPLDETVTLRAPTPADLDVLYPIFRAAMHHYVDLTWGWDEADQQARFHSGFPLDRALMILAGTEIIGDIATERRAEGWHLDRIEIHPRWQRRGIGTQLVGDLLTRARAEGLPVELQVLKVNPARRLYERLGFAVTGESETHYLMRAEPPAG